MIKLLAETPRDQEMIEKFQRAYENLKKFVDRQNKRIRDLEEQLEEYRKRHPATVGMKNGKAYGIAVASSAASEQDDLPGGLPDGRNPGAQPGHKGHSRSVPRITDRIKVKASQFTCPECSSQLVRKGIRTRVIEDIPIVEPRIVQYRIERMYCKHCGKIFEPEIEDAFPNARFSIRTMLIAAYFKISMRMSLENVSATMKEVFGIQISEGEIQGMLYQLSDSLGSEYGKLLDAVRRAPSRNMDTTSWRENGENLDMWTFVTRGEAIFHIAKSNNHEVALDLLGKHRGTDIHDRFKAFDTLARKTKNSQQYCWSHIICDAKELEEFYGDEGRRIKRSLQTVYDEAKKFNGHGTMEDVEKLHHKLVFLLDSDYDHSRSRKFADNLLKRRKEWLFRFVMDPDVEPINNRAERALRPAVIYRKVSGGTRSHRGSVAYERIHSVFYTTKLRKKSFLRDVPDMLDRKDPHPG